LAGEAFVSSPEQNMPNRTAKFVSTIAVGCLAGAALTGVSHGATPAPAADECLSGPKDQAPSGSHWYFRVDRATKRHCWYLGPQHDTRAQAAPANAPSNNAPSNNALPKVSQPAAAKAQTTVPGTVANAHAELTASQARGAQEASAAGQVPLATPIDAAATDNSAGVNAADAQRSLIATRWPDRSAADAPDATEPVVDSPQANPQPVLAASSPPAALLAADSPSENAPSEKPSGSIQMLLIAMAGALALAGLVGGVIVRFGGRRRADHIEVEADRSAMWDAVRTEHRPRPVFQTPVAPKLTSPKLATRYPGELRPAGAARATNAPRAAGATRAVPRAANASRSASAPDDKIAEMLARLARSAQT
jgi:hypothetical protein